jgi:cytochrome c oxidase subunit 2
VSLFGIDPPPELRRMLWVWLAISAVTTPLVVIFVGPLLPPGAASDAAHGQQQDNTVMLAIVWPIIAGLTLFFGYVLTRFRQGGEAASADGPPLRGDARVIVLWIATTVVIVVFLATWGAYELFPGEAGAGGGEGAVPLAVAEPADASSALPVQVIGQQWAWTFRYPTYGGLETTSLVLPVGREVRFAVTSIDVVHSFWAIALGVKADAVPDTSNVAFAKPVRLGVSTIRCAELCGLWHGHMVATLRVTTAAAFRHWIAQQQAASAPIKRYLPPFAPTYSPAPTYRAD